MIHLYIISILILLIWINRCFSLTFFNPSMFMYLVWLAFYILHAIIGEGMFISYLSTTYVIFFLFAFNVGELLSLYCYSNVNTITIYSLKRDIITQKKIRKYIIWGIIISIIATIYYFYLFLDYLGGWASWLASDVRAEMVNVSIPIYVRIPGLISYSVAIIASVYYLVYGDKKLMLLATVPTLIGGVAQNGRAGFLMMIVIVFLSILIKESLIKKTGLNKKNLKYLLLFAIAGGTFFIGGAALRLRNANIEGSGMLFGSFADYLLGGISAFDGFLRNPDTPGLGYGKYNFSSLYDLLGIAKNEVGVYTNYLTFREDGSTTNIFSIMRPVIDDFGLYGGMLYMMVIGYIGGNRFFKAQKGDLLALSFMILFYTYLFHSPLLPITVHTSILMSFICPAIFLRYFSNKKIIRLVK